MLVVINFFVGKWEGLWMKKSVVLLVWIACLVLLCFRWVLSHDNREEARLEINRGETVETEKQNHNNCLESSSEVEIAISLGYNKVVSVS